MNNSDELAKEIVNSNLTDETKIEVLKRILKSDEIVFVPVELPRIGSPWQISYTDRTDWGANYNRGIVY